MKLALAAIEQLHNDGVIRQYAICGVVGGVYYSEPIVAMNLEVLVLTEKSQWSRRLKAIRSACAALGYAVTDEAITIEGWPVHFLPAAEPLLAEAVREAQLCMEPGLTLSFPSLEHLIAIHVLQCPNSPNGLIIIYLDSGRVDSDRLHAMLAKHSLLDAWARVEQQSLTPPNNYLQLEIRKKAEERRLARELPWSEKMAKLTRMRDNRLQLIDRLKAADAESSSGASGLMQTDDP